MPRIFLTYYRRENADSARRLFDTLKTTLGHPYQFVLSDVDVDPRSNEDWVAHEPRMVDAVRSCDVFLAVLDSSDWDPAPSSTRKEFRFEIEAALRNDTRVVPVLLGRGERPALHDLPDNLRPLRLMQFADVRYENWNADVRNLGTLLRGSAVVLAPAPPPSASMPVDLPVYRHDVGSEANQKLKALKRWFKGDGWVNSATRGRGAGVGPVEEVKLGAATPKSVSSGQEFVAHFVAYPAGREREVRKLLKAQSPKATPVLGARTCRWRRGITVAVRVRGECLEIEQPEQTFTWKGDIESLDFAARVVKGTPQREVVVKYDVLVEGFVVAGLRLTMKVTARPGRDKRTSVSAYAPRTAFASYSKPDRSVVTHMIGAIQRAAGIDVFEDCLDLNPGDEWKPRLGREIKKRDLFMLFWSASAAASTWVEWEWRLALRNKRGERFQIHPLEPDVTPPKPLQGLHFGSVHSIVADYYARR